MRNGEQDIVFIIFQVYRDVFVVILYVLRPILLRNISATGTEISEQKLYFKLNWFDEAHSSLPSASVDNANILMHVVIT